MNPKEQTALRDTAAGIAREARAGLKNPRQALWFVHDL